MLALLIRGELVAQAGGAASKVAALNAVIGYRANWLRDSTKFDACSVYRTVGSPEQVSAGLLPAFRDLLVARAAPCDTPETVDPRREVRVLVDSVNLAGPNRRVYLTVRRGEETHREEYQLVNPDAWAVDRVVLSGAVRFYYARPGAGPPAP
ncbi:hypothetical protein [Longimicrobium sp.]|uniref:hypothetical protein n=1 Tax=Longimicrobium sp. TaxID=2029185 RepID=UPI002B8AC462|nr:hypothetical protein [Longimicrobium sp.]HSU14817.1 hypothetical protein [Longimicrobium sp.]